MLPGEVYRNLEQAGQNADKHAHLGFVYLFFLWLVSICSSDWVRLFTTVAPVVIMVAAFGYFRARLIRSGNSRFIEASTHIHQLASVSISSIPIGSLWSVRCRIECRSIDGHRLSATLEFISKAERQEMVHQLRVWSESLTTRFEAWL